MSLWVQFNYRRVTQSDLSPYWSVLEPSPPARESRERASHSSRVSRVLVKRAQGRKENKQESTNSLFFSRRSDSRAQETNSRRKNEGRQLNSLPTDRHALLSERLDGTGYIGEP